MADVPTAKRKWLSVIEAAEYVGVSENTIWRRMEDGMPHHRFGPKLVRFDPDEIDAWIRKEKGA